MALKLKSIWIEKPHEQIDLGRASNTMGTMLSLSASSRFNCLCPCQLGEALFSARSNRRPDDEAREEKNQRDNIRRFHEGNASYRGIY